MTILPKALVGAVAAGAMAIVPTAAASAQSRYDQRDNNRGISIGEIIAGAVVLGGVATVAGAIGRSGNYRDDERYYRNGNYNNYNSNPRAAVEQCVNAANRDARNRGYRSAQVTQVRDVNDTRHGWKVKGNLQVDSGGNYYNRGGYNDRGYANRGYNNGRYDNRYGYNDNRDAGSFTCWIDRGRVSKMDYSGIRGM